MKLQVKRRRCAMVFLPFVISFLFVVSFFLIIGPDAKANEAQTSTAPTADLDIRVQAGAQKVRPDGVITWTIHYTNTTGMPMNNVVISATVSDLQEWDGTYSDSPPVSAFTYTINSGGGYYITWTLSSLPAGQSGSILFHTQAYSTTEPSAKKEITLLGVAAEIASQQSGGTGSESSDVVMVVGPILEVTKAAASSVLPGRTLVYTLTVSNLTRDDSIAATNIVLTDVLPEQTTFIAASDGGGLNAAGTDVVWHWNGTLDVGTSKDFTFMVRVNPTASSGFIIRNKKTEYFVASDEIKLEPVVGKRDVNVKVLGTLQKSVLAETMQGDTAVVYPGDYVVYTIDIYNPLTITLNGVMVTDTLPGEPMPFSYIQPENGSPPPTVSLDGRSLTWVVDLPPLGKVTRSFQVQIPRQIAIPANRTYAIYKNTLSATHSDAVFSTETNLAPVKVLAPLTMKKIVKPGHVLNGDTIVYTITLTNDGPYLVSHIRLTDTMEGGFIYQTMLSGPQPINPGSTTNPVVWDNIQVPAGEQYQLSFSAYAYGEWLETYYNNLDAYSPDVSIPSRTRQAGVKIDSPVGLNKTADPTETYPGQIFTYNIEVSNQSADTWQLAEVQDALPQGFYQHGGDNPGGSTAIIDLNASPVDILPGTSWQGSFDVDVTSDVDCDVLPKTFRNDPGDLAIHLTSPANIWAVNAVGLGQIKVYPNVYVDLIPYRKVVVAGSYVTYTLRLHNISPAPVNNAIIELTLHDDVSYQGYISGLTPYVNGQLLTWDDVDVPSGAIVTSVFRVRVKPTASTGNKAPLISITSPGVCFSKLGKGEDEHGNGVISVKDEVIVLTKKALATTAPPLSLVEYQLTFENLDVYSYTLRWVTDTMPSGFTYYDMVSGPEPQVQGNKLIWSNVELPGEKKVTWKLRLRTMSLYGNSEQNKLHAIAWGNETPITPVYSESIAVLPIFDLDKTADRAYVLPGGNVIYTIVLVNLSDIDYEQIHITDTLPYGFTYNGMIAGTPPASLGENKTQPVWQGIDLRGGCSVTNYEPCTLRLTFSVQVDVTTPEGLVYNTVYATSPSGSIPGPINSAPVNVGEALLMYLPVIKR